jgi:L-ascorbate metabolism protein UlaG (beta-lactamase superfamily)
MKIILCILFLLIGLSLKAQPEQLFRGKISIQPIQHATFVLTYKNNTIYVDPTGGVSAFSGQRSPDLILITDIHGDHYDLKTLESVATDKTTLIAPQAVANLLSEGLKKNLIVLNNFSKTRNKNITVTAIPMYNLPETADSRHPKGRGNGYLIKAGGKKVYISGDTEDIKEMRDLKRVDLAFVCMNLPYTMDVTQASNAVIDFKPKIVYPYHYRGQNGFSDVAKFKDLITAASQKIDVRLLNWYPPKK